MAIVVESGWQWLRAAAAEVVDRVSDPADRVAVSAAITQAQMTRTAFEAIDQEALRLAEQAIGARGLLRPHPIERIGRDLTLYLRQPGPDAAVAAVGQAWLAGAPLPAICAANRDLGQAGRPHPPRGVGERAVSRGSLGKPVILALKSGDRSRRRRPAIAVLIGTRMGSRALAWLDVICGIASSQVPK